MSNFLPKYSSICFSTGWTSWCSNLGRGKTFFCPLRGSYRLWGQPSLLLNSDVHTGQPSFLLSGYQGSFSRVNRPGRDIDYWSPSSTELKHECSCTSVPPLYIRGVDKDKLRIYFHVPKCCLFLDGCFIILYYYALLLLIQTYAGTQFVPIVLNRIWVLRGSAHHWVFYSLRVQIFSREPFICAGFSRLLSGYSGVVSELWRLLVPSTSSVFITLITLTSDLNGVIPLCYLNTYFITICFTQDD